MDQESWGSRGRSERSRLTIALAIALGTVSFGLPAALHADEGQDTTSTEAGAVGAEADVAVDGAAPPPPEEVTTPPEETIAPPEDPETAPVVVPTDESEATDGDTGEGIDPAADEPVELDPSAEVAQPTERRVSAARAQPKVTICHRTGSETNPFVEITIALPALPAHLGNHGDIYPVPAGGCPTAEESVEVCHATGDEADPFEVISVPASELVTHLGHGDIYPVPEGGCPAAAESVEICHATDGGDALFEVITVQAGDLATHLGHGDIYPVPDEGCPELEVETGGGGGGNPEDRGLRPGGGGGSNEPTASPPEDSLPFTGLSVSALLLLGGVLLFLGWAVRVIYGPTTGEKRFAWAGGTLDHAVEQVAWDEIAPERDRHPQVAGGRTAAKATVLAVTIAGVAAAYVGWLLNRD